MLCDGHRDARDVHFLEAVAPKVCDRHVARDGDERNGVHVRRRDARHEVGRAGRRKADARPACCARIPVRRMRGALFVRGEHVAQRPVAVECVVDVQHGAARVAENSVHALFF